MTAICLVPPLQQSPMSCLDESWPSPVKGPVQGKPRAEDLYCAGDARRVSLGEWPEWKRLSAPGPF